MARLFDELKRRNLIRVGIAYLVAAWLLLQITDILVPILALPESAARFVLLLLVIGLIPALIFAWAFELTPEGVKRERDVDRSQSTTSVTGRKFDFAIIAMMAAAIVYLVIDNYVLEPAPIVASDIERSIAVLPFRNRSNIVEDSFFVDGMHDDLLTQLSRLSSIEKVISRTSTEQYRNTTKPIPQIGQELGVATILEGGVQRSGSQVRINVQLIDARTDEHLWARTYDKELTAENLFTIQSEITREIVAALHGVLSEREEIALDRMPTNDLDAYAEFVLGRREMTARTGESVLRAKAHFEKAVEIDSEYALAYVGLAESLALQPEYLGVTYEEMFEVTQAAIDKALSIDPISGEAYTSLAGLRQVQSQPEEAERFYLRAIELSPGYATAYHWYYTHLRNLDRDEEALVQLIKAIELDPLAPVLTDNLANMYRKLGRHQEAKATLQHGIERNPKFPTFYLTGAYLLIDEGRLGEALIWAQTASKLNPSHIGSIAIGCSLYLDLGDVQSGERCYLALNKEYPEDTFGEVAWLRFNQLRFADALDLLKQQIQSWQDPSILRFLSWRSIAFGDSRSARLMLEEIDPSLFGDGIVVVTPHEIFSTVAAAYSLFHDDETDRANYLFDQALDVMQSMRRTGTFGYGALDVFVHVTRSDEQLAIVALRDAIRSGWRSPWWELRFPHYASMQDYPEWVSLIAEIEVDIRKQRQWFDDHKNDPIF